MRGIENLGRGIQGLGQGIQDNKNRNLAQSNKNRLMDQRDRELDQREGVRQRQETMGLLSVQMRQRDDIQGRLESARSRLAQIEFAAKTVEGDDEQFAQLQQAHGQLQQGIQQMQEKLGMADKAISNKIAFIQTPRIATPLQGEGKPRGSS